MKILIAVFAALALSACASPPASNAPALAASTSKAPYDYAMCVLPKWQRQAPGVALVEEGRGYRLADAGQWLEVQPARGGSLVRIHDQQPWVTRGAFIDAARDLFLSREEEGRAPAPPSMKCPELYGRKRRMAAERSSAYGRRCA
ncbi:hypothetical protein KZ798_18225 [Pseudomonas aeruginosa]|nr:hypothetical protein KZ798_18225 [Pseudomonas aeruginosa]